MISFQNHLHKILNNFHLLRIFVQNLPISNFKANILFLIRVKNNHKTNYFLKLKKKRLKAK